MSDREHYDEIKATLQGLHSMMEQLANMQLRIGPIGTHARGYTHKITAALHHLEALSPAPSAAHEPAHDSYHAADTGVYGPEYQGQPAQPTAGARVAWSEASGGGYRLFLNGEQIHPPTPLYVGQPEATTPADDVRELPAGLIDRIRAAEQRIQDNHAPRRIPAEPGDVDLVLTEVRCFLEGKPAPFWVKEFADREAARRALEGKS